MKILIVDDQRSMRMITRSVVEAMGHQCQEANCGDEAVKLCSQQSFDLVLLDVEMPGLNGFEAAHAIREQTSEWFPIIFISAKTDPKFFVEGIRSGGDIYLFKPIVPEVLESMINAMQRIAGSQLALQEAKIKMERLANEDALTGLVNRRGFENALSLEMQRSGSVNGKSSLILIDVDQFKAYNDNYGHDAGDECLKEVAKILLASVRRGGDLVARHGGEEFVILLPSTDSQGAMRIADRIIETLETTALPHEYSSVAPYVTCSGGVVERRKEHDARDLLKAADEALYKAKGAGRNQFTLFE